MDILLVEDDPVNRLLLERILTLNGNSVTSVASAEEALERIEEKAYPMLFLDIGLPGMSGLDLIRHIRVNDTKPPTYVLVGTGETGSERMNEILDAGADDYVAKPYQKSILETRLVVAAQSIDNLRERSRLEQELIHMAEHDPLTGLLNRRQLSSQLSKAARSETPTVFLQLDLDHFKQINDSFGHLVGDQHLIQVAQLLHEILPDEASIVRLGGDEFVALIPDFTVKKVYELAEHLIQSIQNIRIEEGENMVRSGASVGITSLRPEASPEEILKEADLACYYAKSLGKSCAQIYVPFDPELLLNQVKNDMVVSGDEDRLGLWFQPVCDLHTGAIKFHEALLRFLPAKGKPAVAAAMFMAEIKRVENAPSLDRFVVRDVCRSLAKYPELTASVNIDSSSICDWDFMKFVQGELKASGVSGTRLILEITEANTFPDLSVARSVIEKLAEMDIRCAIDDLGAGFSSITVLKHLPIRLVKVDGELMRDLSHDRFNRAFVEALVRLAEGLDFEAVGERIETEEEWIAARQLGISYGQGHLIGAARAEPYDQSELQIPL